MIGVSGSGRPSAIRSIGSFGSGRFHRLASNRPDHFIMSLIESFASPREINTRVGEPHERAVAAAAMPSTGFNGGS